MVALGLSVLEHIFYFNFFNIFLFLLCFSVVLCSFPLFSSSFSLIYFKLFLYFYFYFAFLLSRIILTFSSVMVVVPSKEFFHFIQVVELIGWHKIIHNIISD